MPPTAPISGFQPLDPLIVANPALQAGLVSAGPLALLRSLASSRKDSKLLQALLLRGRREFGHDDPEADVEDSLVGLVDDPVAGGAAMGTVIP